MNLRFAIGLFMAVGLTLNMSAQDANSIYQDPAISPNGNEIAFSYQGDIWTVSAQGGRAQRLTIHESYEARPQWNKEGSHLVFQGNRHGNNDVFVIDKNGQNLVRKTFHSTADYSPSWAPDGSIYFNSRRLWQQTERNAEIFVLDPKESTPRRALGGMGYNPTVNAAGDMIAFERGWCRVVREAYRGAANRDIWVWNKKSDTYVQVTDFEGQDHMPVWGQGNRLYFLSARNGRYNIYAMTISGGARPSAGNAVALTNFTDEGIRSFQVNAKGQIVFTRGDGGIFYMASDNAKPKLVNITTTSDFRFYPEEKERFTSGVEDFAVSPNEKNIAFTVHGEIFVTRNDKEKSRTTRITDHPYRDRYVQWLNDSTLLFVSDRSGQEELYAASSADPEQSDLYLSMKSKVKKLTSTKEGVFYYDISPDKKRISIEIGRGQVDLADIDEKGKISNQKTIIDGWAGVSGLRWSPDSKWLAYSAQDLDFNSEIFIHKADGSSKPVNVSMHPRNDFSPFWSPDGSKLGFISDRNSMNSDVWFVWLKKDDWEKTRLGRELAEETASDKKGGDKKDKKDAKKSGAKPVVIDLANIHRRLVQVTSENGNEGSLLIGPKGDFFYYTTNNGGRITGTGDRAFKKIKWDGSDASVLSGNFRSFGLEWDKKGSKIYNVSRGRLSVFNTSSKKSEARPFAASMTIDKISEREQIMNEVWRALNAGFYDPNFHGQDWEQLRKKYRERILKASTAQDFRAMVNEMLGQLNASHMGLYGSNPEETQADRTGYLGVEVQPERGGVVITRKIGQAPADRKESMLRVGDKITAVNGQKVDASVNFWKLMDETRNDLVSLEVESRTGKREVIIEPAASLGSAIYEDWVEERRRLTDQYSNGQLGYIHIRGMNWPSFEVFERELTASAYGKKGLIIDVRNNGGGWTTDMVMAVLNTRQHSYTVPRGATDDLKNHGQFKNNYPFGERLPFPVVKVPTIAMCNEGSYSNAEIFSHAYKALGHGKLVGTPTFGAVISTGGQGLIDGSFVRMPFRGWFVKESGMNMENNPATPDIIVEMLPDSKAKKSDPQLKRAVDELLSDLK